jgi:poly-gamma-glutamate synthesis protein (capsule biosynthesis protein)
MKKRALRHGRNALAVLLLVALAACDGGDGDRASEASTTTTIRRPRATTTTTTTTTVPVTTTTRGPRGSGEPVTLAFGGDVHFEGFLRSKLAADPAGLLAPIAPVLQAADLAMVNLETALTERGEPEPKQFTFRTNANALTALAAAGVDVASMANNHGRDFGPVGLEDSLAAEQASGFPIIGIGRDATEAYAPYRAEIKGQRIAIIAATQVLDAHLVASWTATDTQPGLASAKDLDRLTAAVRDARSTSDTVVVFLHWGVERTTCPSTDQQTLAQQLVDAGADIVVGAHAHRVLGGGRLGTALVDYGLGNFVWYSLGGGGSVTGVLRVTATGRDIDAYEWVPAYIRSGVPVPLTGDDVAAAQARWDERRGCTGLAP